MIKLEKLQKSFHGRPVLRDLSFEAPDGAITGLLGVNGAGKTTTLRAICGVLQPESGSITIDDETGESGSPQMQQNVGALLDHMGLYARLTVRENLEYFGRLRGMSGQSLSNSVDRVISILGGGNRRPSYCRILAGRTGEDCTGTSGSAFAQESIAG